MPAIFYHNRVTGLDAIHELMWISATDPAADPTNDVQPFQWWMDIALGTTLEAGAIFKTRNGGNTAWVVRCDLAAALAAKQPLDSDLTAIAGLISAANKIPRFTGSGTADLLDFSTDGTFASNSDTKIPSEKAIKTFAQALITGGASDVMIFKGVIDCSVNTNYPAADAGNLYKVSVAGKIGGASGPNVEVGDTIYCLADGTASGTQAGVGASWDIVQVNIDGAVIGPTSVTDSRIALFDGATGKLIKDGGKLLTDLIANTLLTTLGDTMYASAANTPARLAGNSTATKKFLRQTGTGSVSAAPAWDTIAESDLPGASLTTLVDGATITWTVTGKREDKAQLTIAGARTLAITGASAGFVGVIHITESGASRSLALPAGSIVANSGAGAIALSGTSGGKQKWTVSYDGTNYWWEKGATYT